MATDAAPRSSAAAPVRAVFNPSSMYQKIHVAVDFCDPTMVPERYPTKLVGGTSNDPDVIPAWLRAKMGLADEHEVREKTRQILIDLGVVPENATQQDIIEASKALADETHKITFKRTNGLVYVESRIVKAAIKENVNILFAGESWGRTRKGPKGYTAERVFVKPDRIVVGTTADLVEDTFIGHPTGPKGPMSTIGFYDYVEGAQIEFTIWQLMSQYRMPVKEKGEEGGANGRVAVSEPALDYPTWGKVFGNMQLGGVGAMRSQGFGQFTVTGFEMEKEPVKEKPSRVETT